MSDLPPYKQPRLLSTTEMLARHRQNMIDSTLEAYRHYLSTLKTEVMQGNDFYVYLHPKNR